MALAACTRAAVAGEPRRDSYGDPLHEHVIARLGTVRFRHSAPVIEVFFSPDGMEVLSCDFSGGVHVWQLATAERLKVWHFPDCREFAAAPDGKTLVAAADDGALLLIDTATGAIRNRLRGHATQVGAMAISRDSQWLASATWDLFEADNDSPHEKNLCLWNLHSGERVRSFELPDRITSVLAFDGTGKRLFAAGGSQGFAKPGMIRLWNFGEDTKSRDIVPVPTAFTLFEITPRGDALIAPRDSETLVVVDLTAAKERGSIKIGKATGFALSNDGAMIAVQPRSPDKQSHCTGVALFDLKTGGRIREFERPHYPLAHLKWSPDDRFVAFSDERTVCVIDVTTGRDVFHDDEARSSIESIAAAKGEKRLIAAAENSRFGRGIRLWEQTGPATFTDHHLGDPGDNATGLVFSGPGVLVSSSAEGGLSLWDVETRKVRRRVFQGTKRISALTLNGDGRLAAFVHDDAIHIVDIDAGRGSVLVQGDVSYSDQLAFTEDSIRLLYRQNRQVKERSTLVDETENLLPAPRDFTSFALSGDGKWLVTNRALSNFETKDSELVVSDRKKGNVVAVIKTPKELCRAVVFSPDGKLLAGGTSLREGKNMGRSVGGVLNLWQTSGKQLAKVAVESAIRTLAFTPDGEWIVTGHEDSTILVWDSAALLGAASK